MTQNPQPVLLSLVSRQVWPHILSVVHLKPSKLVLLHSDNDESKTPAQRLKKFFDQRSNIIAKGITRLERIPHDDYEKIQKRLDKVKNSLHVNSACLLNFTGGNKLMATAAFCWSELRGVRSFYLERGSQLIWFTPPAADSSMETSIEKLDVTITNSLDPVSLLRCQTLESDVEREGERLTLSDRGRSLDEKDFFQQLGNSANPVDTGLLNKEGTADAEAKAGDKLESATASVLLKLGVQEVRRSLRLKVHTSAGISSRLPHAEIDLLFNWNGKLWLVDCKDRISEDNLMKRLRGTLPPGLSPSAKALLERIDSELKTSPTKVLKEDLIAINDMGGLLGQIVCVRKSPLPGEAKAYARRNRIEIIRKDDMVAGFQRLLHPERPASTEQLARLEQHFI